MSTRTYSVVFNAAGSADLPAGRFFFVKSASAALSIETVGNPGAPVRFENVGAGLKFKAGAEQRWKQLRITSAAVQTVEVVISEESEVDISSTVTVSGSVTVVAQPSTTIATPARVALSAAADTLIVAANASRKRLRIQVPSTEVNSAVIGPTGSLGAAQGFEIQPGTNEPVDTLAAVYGRGVGAAVNVQVFEET